MIWSFYCILIYNIKVCWISKQWFFVQVKFSESTNKNNVAVVLEADQTSAARVQKESRYANMLLEVLASESEKTVGAIQRERDFVDKFWEHAADTLLTVLVKVYAEVQLSMMKEESKIYFRSGQYF